MPTKTARPGKPKPRLSRPDPDEAAFREAWAAAEKHNLEAMRQFARDVADARARRVAGRKAKVRLPQLIEAIQLPAFGDLRSAHASRELLGRYLHDRDANVVHDCYAVAADCQLDAIVNGTFIHFGGELDAALPADVTVCSCMTEA